MRKPAVRKRTQRKAASGKQFDLALRLGSQIRQVRQIKGMRLRDLAEKCGYSESMISRIENDKSTPSLHTLHSLATSLGLTVSELLSKQPAESNLTLRGGQRLVIGRSTGIEAEVMIPLGRRSSLQSFLVRLRPGARCASARQHDGEEVGYVVKGELLLKVTGKTYRLQSGDSFFFSSRLPHEYSNPTRNTVTEVVWVNTPASL
jgi:transcriptional regulator with XRE-family HTH domain